MSTRRTLSTFGVLMAVTALFVPAPVPAQTVMDVEEAITAVAVGPTSPASHDMLSVTWNFTRESAAIAESTDMFRVYYGTTVFTTAGASLLNAMGSMDVAVPTVGLAGTATLTGLKAGTEYFVAVARVRTTTAGGAVAIGAPGIQATGATTAAAPTPDRVLGVEITPGDGMLMVGWDAPYPGASGLTIKAYHLNYRTSKTTSPAKAAGEWMDIVVMTNSGTIANLMNGTMYDIRVAAKNSADGVGAWSETMMATPGMGGTGTTPTPTPALPLFGILALFGGLLAAGRARLRR